MSAYVDSELPGVEMLAVRQHVNLCPDCKNEFEAILRVKRAFGQLASKYPRLDLAAEICAKVQAQSPQHRFSFFHFLQMRRPVSLRFAGMAAAASIAILGFVVTHTGNGSDGYIYSPLSSTVAVSPVSLHDASHLFAIPSGAHLASFNSGQESDSSQNSWASFQAIPHSVGYSNATAFWATDK
jgi:anti-sigma factor RsiW